MSGFTPVYVTHFRDLLGSRGYTMGKLRAEVGCCHRHFSQIVWGHLKGDGYWAKIRACVTAAEWAELLHGEHCATWNTAQLALEAESPGEFFFLQRAACGWCRKPLEFSPCISAMSCAPNVTHGICPSCYAVQRAELDALRPAQIARDVTPDSFAPVRRHRHRAPAAA